MAEAQLSATIDGKVYPIQSWQTTEESEILREVWRDGFLGGITEYTRRTPDRYWQVLNLDTTRHPEVRLRPRLGDANFPASVTTTNLDTTLPVYGFLARSPNGTEYVYVLNGRRSFKIQVSDGTLAETKDFGAGAQCGRPALFEGKWYVPCGASVDAQELTTITNPAGGNDTWNTINVNALAFAAGSDDGIAQLARAHTLNLVDVTANVTRAAGDWSADDFEVGDSSTSIVDLHFIDGEYMVVKQDGPWLMDVAGNSFFVQDFTGRTESPADPNDGANSFSFGPYFYWVHRTGFKRFLGQRVKSVGFESEPRARELVDGLIPHTADGPQWRSAAATGSWIYGTRGPSVFQGHLREDGTPVWYGALYSNATANNSVRVFITESDSSAEILLWICEDGLVRRIRLEHDGGSAGSTQDTADKRGDASLTGRIRLPFVPLSDSHKRKQLRRLWTFALGTWTNVTGQFSISADWVSTRTLVGSSFTGTGLHEVAFTPGSGDLVFVVSLALDLICAGGYSPTNTDPRVTEIGIEAVTPTIVEALIVATPSALKGRRMSVATVMQAIRNLVNGPAITIQEPDQGGPRDAFTGYVVGLSEQAIGSGKGESSGYLLRLRIERFDYGS